jgi:hypothetical protein
MPRPNPSTPALFDIQVSPVTSLSARAAMQFSGIPHKPKPPSMSVIWLSIPLIASRALLTTLFIVKRISYKFILILNKNNNFAKKFLNIN